jgi:aryl-alcohol dehydrogenase-like predicted oxidoreductase
VETNAPRILAIAKRRLSFEVRQIGFSLVWPTDRTIDGKRQMTPRRKLGLQGPLVSAVAGTVVEPPEDFRANNPRVQGDRFHSNKDRFAFLHSTAKELGISSAQLAIAWLLHQGEDIVPIPGTRSPSRIAERTYHSIKVFQDSFGDCFC